jgi:GNAT superfamily N-acetyltransferase
MSVQIARFHAEARGDWEILARAYKQFYNTPTTDAEYVQAWGRLLNDDGVHGLGAYLDGRMVGCAHYLFHTGTWVQTVCYLQDLYVLPEVRRQGVARALVEAVAAQARERRAERYYWLTQEHNKTARSLYDKVARCGGFLRYDYPL